MRIDFKGFQLDKSEGRVSVLHPAISLTTEFLTPSF